MANKVLLARPHAFIVKEMRPFLEAAGYQPEALANLGDVSRQKLAGYDGAIISMAVVSSIPARADEVLGALRQSDPNLPVIFAGLNDFQQARSAVERIVKPLHPNAEIITSTAQNESHGALGRAHVFLYLSKDDLSAPASAESAARILRQHFR